MKMHGGANRRAEMRLMPEDTHFLQEINSELVSLPERFGTEQSTAEAYKLFSQRYAERFGAAEVAGKKGSDKDAVLKTIFMAEWTGAVHDFGLPPFAADQFRNTGLLTGRYWDNFVHEHGRYRAMVSMFGEREAAQEIIGTADLYKKVAKGMAATLPYVKYAMALQGLAAGATYRRPELGAAKKLIRAAVHLRFQEQEPLTLR